MYEPGDFSFIKDKQKRAMLEDMYSAVDNMEYGWEKMDDDLIEPKVRMELLNMLDYAGNYDGITFSAYAAVMTKIARKGWKGYVKGVLGRRAARKAAQGVAPSGLGADKYEPGDFSFIASEELREGLTTMYRAVDSLRSWEQFNRDDDVDRKSGLNVTLMFAIIQARRRAYNPATFGPIYRSMRTIALDGWPAYVNEALAAGGTRNSASPASSA